MSQENVEIVRRVYEAWAQGDFSDDAAYDPDVAFEMVDWPEKASVRGVDAMRRAWVSALHAWDDFRAEPDDFIESGPNVVVLNHIWPHGKVSGAEVRADVASVFTLKAGKVVRLALYWNVGDALEAAGLRE